MQLSGPDDYNKEYCVCPAGVHLEKMDEVVTTDMGEKMTKEQLAQEMKAEVAHHD